MQLRLFVVGMKLSVVSIGIAFMLLPFLHGNFHEP